MLLSLLAGGILATGTASAVPVALRPTFLSDPVGIDADDPAIWHRGRLTRIIGTDKDEAKGGLAVYGLDGKLLQRIDGLKRPNNGDVEYGLPEIGDVYVCAERKANRLRVFRVASDGTLADVTGETATVEEPMGISLYRRPKDGAIFAIVSPKTGPATGYLAWYRLTPRGGRVDATFVARAGEYSGRKEIESILVDDARGTVWYSDETFGNRAVPADPDARGFGRQLAFLNSRGWTGDHEGIALVERGSGGYLLFTDQIAGSSLYHARSRDFPYRDLGSFTIGADETDGIEATGTNLGPGYERGLFVAMNSSGKNFPGLGLREVERALNIRL